MSGIVGIVHKDDSQCDQILVRKLTDYLAFRGPDAQNVWAKGPTALGNALLRNSPDDIDERQPCTLDGRYWITADARLDDTEELRRRLAEAGLPAAGNASDAQLILGAYRAWGEDCLQHLAGDFSFALWDEPNRQLFCARDQFGMRQFFYGMTENSFIFSNTLACLRLHPELGLELDEHWLGDWLLFDFCLYTHRTVFADVRRLPAAHCLVWNSTGLKKRRYWTLPAEHPVLRFRRDQDYIEELRRLLKLSIRDRVRTPKSAIFMSGGLDSTTLAAATKDYLAEKFGHSQLRAFTQVYEQLVEDPENSWAPQAALELGVPLEKLTLDNHIPYVGWIDPDGSEIKEVPANTSAWSPQPEPANDPVLDTSFDCHRLAARWSRMVIHGLGPDMELAWPDQYFIGLVAHGKFFQAFRQIASYWRRHRRHPPLGLRWLLTNSWRKPKPWTTFPAWLNEDFVRRIALRDRFREVMNSQPAAVHATRQKAYANLTDAGLGFASNILDAGVTGVAQDVCYPFMDLRLVHFFLSIPPFPWCISKELLRTAGIGVLSERVRTRPKTLVPFFPAVVAFQKLDAAILSRYTLPASVDPFIRRHAVPGLEQIRNEKDFGNLWSIFRPYSLAYWFRQSSCPPESSTKE